jgi:succinate dehydrogenase / fumarate reductase cytochrome b subunit
MYKTTGFVSFLLRRVTGVALVLYLFTHIWVIGGAVSGESTFNERMVFLTSPIFKILEIGLLAAVFYHGFDGLRLLLINWFKITDKRKSMFATAFVLTVLMVAAGGTLILLELLHVGG